MEKKGLSNILKNQKKWNISKKEEKMVKEYREKQKKNKQYFKKLGENLFRLKKYYDYDDPDYEGIKDVQKLCDKIDEDYCKPVKTKGAFNNNYREYECRGDKEKNLLLEEYFDMIRPYLRHIKRSFRQNN